MVPPEADPLLPKVHQLPALAPPPEGYMCIFQQEDEVSRAPARRVALRRDRAEERTRVFDATTLDREALRLRDTLDPRFRNSPRA